MGEQKRMAYAVVRTNSSTNYKKTLFLRQGRSLEIPQCRFIVDRKTFLSRRLYSQVSQIIRDLVDQEFKDLIFQSIKYIGKQNNRPIYLVEYTGWPVPLEGHFSYVFEDDFQVMTLNTDSQEVLSIIRDYDQQKTSHRELVHDNL